MSQIFTCSECFDLFEVEDPDIAESIMEDPDPAICPSCQSFLGNFEFDEDGMVII